MELIADILLVAGALGAGLYCFVLSRRLKRFTDLEKGVGGAVAVLSSQVDELKKSLDSARNASDHSGDLLKDLTHRAESVAQRLELMMASMHDIVPADDSVPASPKSPDTDDGPNDTETEGSVFDEPNAAPAVIGPTPTTKSDAETAPKGVMFLRHDRKQSETSA